MCSNHCLSFTTNFNPGEFDLAIRNVLQAKEMADALEKTGSMMLGLFVDKSWISLATSTSELLMKCNKIVQTKHS